MRHTGLRSNTDLIDDTNTADAVWQPYSSTNLTVILPGNGTYDVEVGLKGFAFCTRVYGDPISLQERIDAAQAEGSVAKLSLLASECETFWPSNTILYFESQNKVGEALEALAKTNSAATQELENQTEKILSKSCPVGARSEKCLFQIQISDCGTICACFRYCPRFSGN